MAHAPNASAGLSLGALLALPHLGASLACGLRGCLASAIRAERPRDLAIWPGLGNWAFDGRIAPPNLAVVLFEPSLADTLVGPGQLALVSEPIQAPLPPRSAAEHGQLRRALRIEDDATVFVFPLRAPSDDLKVLWAALTDADRDSLNDQLTWNLDVHRLFLEFGEPVRPAPPWERLRVSDEGGQVYVDGVPYPLRGTKTGPFLRRLLAAQGEPIQSSLLKSALGEWPARTWKRLPEEVQPFVVSGGQGGATGWFLRDPEPRAPRV